MSTAHLQELFEDHESALRNAVGNVRFRHKLPEGAPEAIDAGLVVPGNRSWEYSDDLLAEDYLVLTDLGLDVTEAQGWTCACAGHIQTALKNGTRISPAIDGFCRNCKASAAQYGPTEHNGLPSCKMCANMASRED